MNRIFLLSLLTLLCVARIAHAEKADSFKPTVINADQLSYNDVQQVNIFIGNVVLTRGTLIMKADRVVVTTDPAGYQFATLYADPGKLANFRQKRDGGVDLWIEGEAERIEYDSKVEIAKLFSKAHMKRLEGTKVTDDVRGQFISYDSRAEFYAVHNTVDGVSKTGAGRVTAVLQPRVAAPAPTASPMQTPTPTPTSSSTLAPTPVAPNTAPLAVPAPKEESK
ncbi:lipopolysaccharide transport periplasmic protein LptA [Herbaspirillum sp. RTI4]|uniref:lipopolysaccharide transport periplasmic protein LptA n=1 Tax=Herbaspirillum sp. RTI4 TaxID=3048640 RepID=UPI002AB39551|nr:lipopolysaccharide transport periplasmic protein LptA [Herbaspirillum sp. RTI4]MDY7577784.1 lipopolysaccharide transport periplasmic protein LptA [Herbaspirillum sp. RTI4]MEA9980788.1 lipopolysaccharide transport periplasmic protein LptA [Herbaspirillum sp. RTI4]